MENTKKACNCADGHIFVWRHRAFYFEDEKGRWWDQREVCLVCKHCKLVVDTPEEANAIGSIDREEFQP